MTISDLAPEEWGLLANTIQQPAKQLVLALVESDVQSILLTDRIKQKTKTVFTLDWNTSISAPELLDQATHILPGSTSSADEFPVLCIRESHLIHSNESQNVDRFWAHANQLREAWADLPACCIFIVGPNSWDAITRSAPDLRSWFVLKLDFRKQARTQQPTNDFRLEVRRGGHVPREIAEYRVAKIEKILATLDKDSINPDTLAHKYRLPLFQALISLGYLKRAAEQYRIIKEAKLPRSAHFSWYRLATIFALKTRRFSEAKSWLDIRQENSPKNGEEQSEIFHQMGALAQDQGNPEVAKTWYIRALEIDKERGSQSDSSVTYHQLGIIAQENRDWVAAEQWYQKSLKIEEKSGPSVGLAGCYFQLGRLHEDQRNFAKAMTYYEESLVVFEELHHRPGTALTLRQLGIIAHRTGNYSDAIDLYKRSLKLSEGLGNEHEILGTLHQLGILAENMENYRDADRLYRRSLEISKRLGNDKGEAKTLHQLGLLAVKLEDYDLAVKLFEQTLGISTRLADKHGMAGTKYELGRILAIGGNLTEAFPLLIESAKLYKHTIDPYHYSIVVKTLGLVFQRADPELRSDIRKRWIDADLPEKVIRAWGKKVVSPAETTEG